MQDGRCDGHPAASFINALSLHSTITVSSIYIPNEIIAAGGGAFALLRAFLLSDSVSASWDLLRGIVQEGGTVSNPLAAQQIRYIKTELAKSTEASLRSLTELQPVQFFAALKDAAMDRMSRQSSRYPLGSATKYRAEEHVVLCMENSKPEFVTEPLGRLPGQEGVVFSEVVRIRRIRQTLAGLGFYRFGNSPQEQDNRSLARRAIRQYFKKHRDLSPDSSLPLDAWLPAVSVSGEGVLISLDAGQLKSWFHSKQPSLVRHLAPAFNEFQLQMAMGYRSPVRNAEPAPMEEEFRFEWFCQYSLIHTLSHILMMQFAFDCGYSEESLAERLYVSVDPDAPMASILIYTASGDSDGTLGGLSSLADSERLVPTIRRALDRARACSSDPICSERAGAESQRHAFNGVACHCCSMTPDLSCENGNRMLDRALLVHPELGYLRDLLR
jgi:hypothetical protein